MGLVEREWLYGRGLGWIDAHLLASARLSSASFWTLDRRLSKIASALDLAFPA
jgi:predicted nucleic acid-binding protein